MGTKREEAYRACQGEVHSHPKIRDFRFYVRESQRPAGAGRWLCAEKKRKQPAAKRERPLKIWERPLKIRERS